jgi:hypothetical protein
MWKLKFDEQGKVVMQGDKPVYVNETGKERPFDLDESDATITKLNGEAKTHREGKETAETKLKAFEGITDPAAALKAIELVATFKDGQLVDAKKLEEVRTAAIEATRKEYEPFKTKVSTLEQALYQEKIGGAFARSPLIVGDKRKLAIPAEIAQSYFGKHFVLNEDGSITAKDSSGNVIYSPTNPGKPASFDEALESLVMANPNRDSIMVGTGNSGGGSNPNQPQNGGAGGPKTWTRKEFDAADQGTRMARSKDGFKVVD